MGRIIQKNNGKTTVFTTGENFNSLTPITNTYYVGVDLSSGYFEKLNPTGSIINLETAGSTFTGGTVSGTTSFTNGLSANTFSATTYYNLPTDIYVTGGTYDSGTATFRNNIGGTFNVPGFSTGGGIINKTYSELISDINSSLLSPGTYYTITDFQTVYDQPDYFVDGNEKVIITTNSGPIEPIIVLATSVNTISSEAYQPAYPMDKITYDHNFNTTEIMTQPAYGRISERIDEYNNRTDYDHRNIEFKRYQTYIKRDKLTGTISDYNCNDGVIVGVGTLFLSELSEGQIIIFDSKNNFGYDIGVKVIRVVDDLNIEVAVDPDFTSINFTSYTLDYYLSTSVGFFSYKETYVGESIEGEYETHTTFNLDGNTLSNYIGDYSKFFMDTSYGNSGFLLANNVFYDRAYSNKIGDRSYNNTTDSWFVRNTISGRFYNNRMTSGFYSNNIGEYFYDNEIYGQFWRNHIGEEFNNNITRDDFQNNSLGNAFNGNIIDGGFYKNEIGNGFNDNTIAGDFFGNDIGNAFNDNIIGIDFINNNILEYFNNNEISNYFSYNIIGNNFNNNTIKDYFGFGGGDPQGNVIGDNFKTNLIDNNFYNNKIGNKFTDNSLGADFENNNIKNYFIGNTIGANFESNDIGNYFGGIGTGNAISDGFKNNSVITSIVSEDFTINSGASVYQNYNCEIFERQDGGKALSYIDNTPALVITAINV
jgi:hypothetical protein